NLKLFDGDFDKVHATAAAGTCPVAGEPPPRSPSATSTAPQTPVVMVRVLPPLPMAAPGPASCPESPTPVPGRRSHCPEPTHPTMTQKGHGSAPRRHTHRRTQLQAARDLPGEEQQQRGTLTAWRRRMSVARVQCSTDGSCVALQQRVWAVDLDDGAVW